jgi:hypothetical protein
MGTTKQKIDLSILSEDAKRELIDFYCFLVDKYGRKTKVRKTKKFEKTVSNPLKVKNLIIPPREQLYER